MKNNIIKTEIKVQDRLVGVMRVDDIDYISLTDIAKYKNANNPGDVIIKWMSNKSSFDFYCLWEELNNKNFKLAESREFKNISANQSFTMSPSRWIADTNAIGFITKRGKYDGGTFAHPDIALEFTGTEISRGWAMAGTIHSSCTVSMVCSALQPHSSPASRQIPIHRFISIPPERFPYDKADPSLSSYSQCRLFPAYAYGQAESKEKTLADSGVYPSAVSCHRRQHRQSRRNVYLPA